MGYEWRRVKFRDSEYDNAFLFLDLIIGDDDKIKDGAPYCGWWGKIKSTEMYPVVLRKDDGYYVLDFGTSSEEYDPKTLRRFDIHDKVIRIGSDFYYEWKDEEVYHFKVEDMTDLVAGKSLK